MPCVLVPSQTNRRGCKLVVVSILFLFGAREATMSMHEIPREQWGPFLENFSLQHEGCIITLESRFPGKGIVRDANNRALECVLTESGDGHERVAIVIGLAAQGQETYFVAEPTHIRFQELGEDVPETLEIENQEGSTTVLRCALSHSHAA